MPDRPRVKPRRRARPLLRKLHLVLGLTVGLWAAVSGLAGSLLVFGDGIDAALNRQLLSVEPQAGRYRLDAAAARVRAAYPDRPLAALELPRTPREPFVFRLRDADDTQIYVHPQSAQILGARPRYGGLMGFVWDLHVHLLAGETGETIAGMLALALMLTLVIGIVLWWPRRRRAIGAFNIRWSRGAIQRLFDLHRVTGAVASPLLALSIFTGVLLVFYGLVTPWLVAGLGGTGRAPLPSMAAPAGISPLPLSRVLARADRALPQARPTRVTFAEPGHAIVLVRERRPSNPHPNGRSFVAVNAYSGEVIQVHDWRAAGPGLRFADYMYPLHIGVALGMPGRILVLLTGLVPALLLVTGAWFWWRKRRRPA